MRGVRINGHLQAITHSRLENDYVLTSQVPDIDLLVGGHDHFYRRDRAARIVKGGEEFRWLSHLIIDLKGDSTPANRKFTINTEVS
jgi:2',3'-cyclic-nucleotide 2'-phosphodiesterase (5'-nucleotidase family)